jgi:micrococcal nuclease
MKPFQLDQSDHIAGSSKKVSSQFFAKMKTDDVRAFDRALRWAIRDCPGRLLLWVGLLVSVLAILAMALQLAATRAAAAPLVVQGDRIRVIDGDTIELPCVRGAACERVRILNIDAPEMRGAGCQAERMAGRRASAELRRLLAGRRVEVRRCEASGRCRDRYGRTLARLFVDGRDVGAAMVRTGHALPWRPGAQERAARLAHWCGRRS